MLLLLNRDLHLNCYSTEVAFWFIIKKIHSEKQPQSQIENCESLGVI